jgi:hypothetical protein
MFLTPPFGHDPVSNTSFGTRHRVVTPRWGTTPCLTPPLVQMEDDDGDEADGMDEALCPLDYPSAGMIRDDDIFRELVATLPAGMCPAGYG